LLTNQERRCSDIAEEAWYEKGEVFWVWLLLWPRGIESTSLRMQTRFVRA
jgi:hypothetical protein